MDLNAGSSQLERLIVACIRHAQHYGQVTEADALSRTLDCLHTRPKSGPAEAQHARH
jgi:hypothetical protein